MLVASGTLKATTSSTRNSGNENCNIDILVRGALGFGEEVVLLLGKV